MVRCVVSKPGQAPQWPAGIGNLSRETPVAFARSSVRGVETAIAFARDGRAPIETAIAFAGEKWAFWVRFSVAEVMVVSRWPASAVAEVMAVSMVAVWGRAVAPAVSRWPASAVAEVMAVSMVAVWGRALVPTVSYWPASVAAEVLLVSKLARGCVLCAKKFALRTNNDPKLAFCGVLGEFFRENTAGWVTLGELFRACCGKGRHSDGFSSKRGVF